jgi:hypothetical protein
MNDGITEVASRCWLVGDCGNCNYYVMKLPASRAIELHSRRMGIRLKVDSGWSGDEWLSVISHCVMRKTELNCCRRDINEEKKNPSKQQTK